MSHKHKKNRDVELPSELIRQLELKRELELQREREQELLNELELERERNKSQQNHHGNMEDILFISSPSPITVGLRGRSLTFQLPCLRLTSQENLSGTQTGQLLGVFINLLRLLGSIVTTNDHHPCSGDFSHIDN